MDEMFRYCSSRTLLRVTELPASKNLVGETKGSIRVLQIVMSYMWNL
jgi:hypothetical protein